MEAPRDQRGAHEEPAPGAGDKAQPVEFRRSDHAKLFTFAEELSAGRGRKVDAAAASAYHRVNGGVEDG